MSNKHNLRRVNQNKVNKATSTGLEIFQDAGDNDLYYKDKEGTNVLIATTAVILPLSDYVDSIGDRVTVIEANDWTYLEVPVSSAEILALWGSPITLLPAPGAGKYYDWECDLEYIYGTTIYDGTAATDLKISQGDESTMFAAWLLTYTQNTYTPLSSRSQIFNTSDINTAYTQNPPRIYNTALQFETTNNFFPTTGDGTLLFKLRYKLRTAGTTL
jgi:hypothetical protein